MPLLHHSLVRLSLGSRIRFTLVDTLCEHVSVLILLVLGGPLYRPGTLSDTVVYLGHVLADLPHPLSLCHQETGVEVPYCEGSL